MVIPDTASNQGAAAGRHGRADQRSTPPAAHSLFGEILDWMLAPLLVLWPIGVGVTYYFANGVADAPYDRELNSLLARVVQEVRIVNREVKVQLPFDGVLGADEQDTQYFQIRGPDGKRIWGDPGLPPPREQDTMVDPDRTYYRNDEFRGEQVRIAYRYLEIGPQERAFVAQVAETRRKRDQLANEMLRSVILPQFLIIPVTAILVWFGLHRGLAPLSDLRGKILARPADDLSPVLEPESPEELRPLITAFNDLLERLEQNMKAQSRFIADAAHQMRTPIAGLKTQTQLALRQTKPEEIHYTLTQVARSVERASRLIAQLLSMARAEDGISTRFQICDLTQVARDIVSDWVPRALEKALDLGFEAPPEPVMVMGDPVLLGEMISNLVDNAIRYTPAGKSVTLRLGGSASPWLEVEDTGIGIAPENRQRIFDPFHRVLGSGVDGTGLGLAIVRRIADSHGASIQVLDNAVDCGTIFRVRFPMTIKTASNPAPGPDVRSV